MYPLFTIWVIVAQWLVSDWSSGYGLYRGHPPLFTIWVAVAQWLECPTGFQKVVICTQKPPSFTIWVIVPQWWERPPRSSQVYGFDQSQIFLIIREQTLRTRKRRIVMSTNRGKKFPFRGNHWYPMARRELPHVDSRGVITSPTTDYPEQILGLFLFVLVFSFRSDIFQTFAVLTQSSSFAFCSCT